MNVYIKSGAISLVSGMLGASLTLTFMAPMFHLWDSSYGAIKAFQIFFGSLPQTFFYGGVPSLILASVIMGFWKAFGKSERGMKLTCLIIGIITGTICGFGLAVSTFSQ